MGEGREGEINPIIPFHYLIPPQTKKQGKEKEKKEGGKRRRRGGKQKRHLRGFLLRCGRRGGNRGKREGESQCGGRWLIGSLGDERETIHQEEVLAAKRNKIKLMNE